MNSLKKKAKQCILFIVVDARKMVNSEASVAGGSEAIEVIG